MLACVARGVLLADWRHRVWLENIARETEEEVTHRIPFQVPSIVAGDALSPRLRAATSYAHCAVALAEMCGFSSVSFSPPYKRRSGPPVQQAALLRGGETAPRHDPIGGLSSRQAVPRGIPLLDKPRTGSHGEPSEWRWRVKHTQLRRGTRASVPSPFPVLSFFLFLFFPFSFFFLHVLACDWKTF